MRIKRTLSVLLAAVMMLCCVPAVSFAAPAGAWTASFDTEAYSDGTISVEIYDAAKEYAPKISWSRGAGRLTADKTPAELFGSGDYYAVVQYEAGSGDPSNLSDAEIEAEFDEYFIAMYGSLPSGQGNVDPYRPDGYPDWGRDDALEWYEAILDNDEFVAWYEDPDNEDYGYDLMTADELVEDCESIYLYDLNDPELDQDVKDELLDELDSDIVSAVNDVAYAYMEYSGGGGQGDYLASIYNQYTLEAKRQTIMQFVEHPEYAPAGYTPPGAGGGDSFVKTVVHLLTDFEKANGLSVGAGFFDACVPLEITAIQVGSTFDYSTYQDKPLYADTAVWRVIGDVAVPASIKVKEQEEESESVDPIMEGLIGNLYRRGAASNALTGLVDPDVPLYVEPGSCIVTQAAPANTESDEPYAIFDWETVSVNNRGGSVSFAGNRSYATINVEGCVLDAAPNIMSLKLMLSGGDVKSACADIELMGMGFDPDTYQFSQNIYPLKVKAGSYGDAQVTCTSANIDMSTGVIGGEAIFVVSFWEKNGIGSLRAGSNTNWTVPELSQTETDFTASLEFAGANGEIAPYDEGTEVNGRMVLSAGDWTLDSAVVMKQNIESMEQYNPLGFDDITVLATRAEYANGMLITRAAGEEHTWFSFEAPRESQVVNAHTYLSVDGVLDLDFTASELLDTGVGTGEYEELGSAEFEAATGTLANGYMSLNESNEGSLRFTYTPEEGQQIPASVSVRLVYLDADGVRKDTSAQLSGAQVFTGTVAIPEDAAILESAVFSSPRGDLLVKNLQAIIVLARAEASLDTTGYALAPEFNYLKVIYGRKVYTMAREGGVFTGLIPRGAYVRQPSGDGMAVFFIDNEPFIMGGSLADHQAGPDAFALDTSTLSDKIRVDILGRYGEDEIEGSGRFTVDERTVNAYTSSSYFDNEGYHFYLERPAAASSAENVELTIESKEWSYKLVADVGEATDYGIRYSAPFERGQAVSITTRMQVRYLYDYMYLDVLCGQDGTTPAQQDLSFDFYSEDGVWAGFGSWYWRTKQLDTSFLDTSADYRIAFRACGAVDEPFAIDETWIRPVDNGENEADPPELVLHEKAAVVIDPIIYSDSEGIPGTGVQVNIAADYDVYYKSAQSGEWTLLPGQIIHSSQITSHLEQGIGSYFMSDAVDLSQFDTNAGLKLVFKDTAWLDDQVNFYGGSYHRLGDEVRLVSGQVLYTNPNMGSSGGITTQYLTSNQNILFPENVNYYSNYAYTWEFGERGLHGEMGSGLISGLQLAQFPRLDLHFDRWMPNTAIVFALRDGEGGFWRFDQRTLTSDAGTTEQFTFKTLPYGSYELLTILDPGAYEEQLISQFAEGYDVVVPATMSARVQNVSFTELDAYVDVTLPPEPVDVNAPGIQSMAVTASKEVAMTGDRLQYTVNFACVPGADEAGRTLSFNSYGSRFDIDGVSLSLVDTAGNRVEGAVIEDDHIVVPENANILTGSLIVTGKINTGLDAFAVLLTIAGPAGNNSAPRFRTRCSVRDFSAVIPDRAREDHVTMNGRGSAGAIITVEATSKTDPSRTASTNIEVGRYGYWTGSVELPVGTAETDTFTVTIKDAGSNVLASGETAYESDTVLPTQISIITYVNGAKNITVGYPGSRKDFESLNNAVLQFGPDYTQVPIEVEITFDDSDPDGYGMTDARRVHDPTLTLSFGSSSTTPNLYYAFYPVDDKTYHYHNTDLDLDIEDCHYSTKYMASFPAYHFGKFGISYELFDGEGDFVLPALDDHTDLTSYATNILGYPSAAAQQYKNAVIETGNWINQYPGGEYVHEGHYTEQILWSDPGIQISDLDEDMIKKDADPDPDMYLMEPFEDRLTDFSCDAVMKWKALDAAELEAKIAELEAQDPCYSQKFMSNDSYLKYVDRSATYSIKYNSDSNTVDLIISTSYNAIYDTGAVDDGAGLFEEKGILERGYFVSENVDSVVQNLALDVASEMISNVTEVKGGVNDILSKAYAAEGMAEKAAKTGAIAKWNSRLNVAGDVVGAGVNALNLGMTIKNEVFEDSKAIINLNALTAEYNKRMQDYADKLAGKITCLDKNHHNQMVSSEIYNIKDSALNEIAAIQDRYRGYYKMNGYVEIAVTATSFIPCPPSVPGAASVLQFLAKEAREGTEAWYAFTQLKDMEQCAIKFEQQMWKAFKNGYDPNLCDKIPPIEPLPDSPRIKPIKIEIEPKRVLDPSGVVYEGLLSNPVEGVNVEIEYSADGENDWVVWDDAPLYNGQQSSYVTGPTGYYQWDVPDGFWRVSYQKDGYNGGEKIYSDVMEVPPIWLDVNQPMESLDQASAEATRDADGIMVVFTKPVKAEDLTAEKLKITNLQGDPVPVVFEATTGDGELAQSVLITGSFDNAVDYYVQATGIRTYAGTASTFTVPVDSSEITNPTKCMAVTADIASGSEVAFNTMVTLSTSTEGAAIYYTTDGSCPCVGSNPARQLYTGPIAVTSNTYLIAYAVKDGLDPSKTTAFIYFVGERPEEVISGRTTVDANSATMAIYLNLENIDQTVDAMIAYYSNGQFVGLDVTRIYAAGLDGVSLARRYEFEQALENVTVEVFLLNGQLQPVSAHAVLN